MLALAALCCLAFLALVSGASAASWLSPVDLSAPLRDAAGADVAMDDAGNVVAVWEREGIDPFKRAVQASIHTTGNSFSEPFDLSVPAQQPSVVMTPSGVTIAAWWHFESPNYVLQTTVRPAGGGFSPPASITAVPSGMSPSRIALEVNPSGDAAVVWLSKDEGTSKNVVEISTMSAGGAFASPVPLSDPAHNAFEPDVAVDPSGKALVVWADFVSAEDPAQIMFSSGQGASFTPAAPLSTKDVALEPQIALDSAGQPTVAWAGAERIEPPPAEPPDFEPSVVEATTRVGEAFSAPDELSDPAKSAFEPQLAISPPGEATVVWLRPHGTNTIAQAAIRPPGGAFAGALDVSEEGEDAARPDLAVNSAGTTTLAWQAGSPTVIQAAIRPPGGSFGSPVPISAPGQPAVFPRVGMDQAGDAVAVWLRSNGSENIAQAAGYDANPPQIRSLSVPPSGTVGIPVGFSADPFDVWPLASTVFNFGDGTAQAGAAVSHAYSAPGAYPVTVTVTDETGATAVASGTIAISPVYEFRIGKHKRNKKRGTVKLTVTVPGPGNVVASGRRTKRRRRRAASAGSVKLLISAKGKARKRLRKRGKARVRVKVSFAPDGGDHSASKRILVVLIRKR